MPDNYEQLKQQTLDALLNGEASSAFKLFKPVFDYPTGLQTTAQWRDALEVFTGISQKFAGPEFVAVVKTAAENPDDTRVLFKLGYELVDQHLYDFAASVLKRAYGLHRHPDILAELALSLEYLKRSEEACQLLKEAPDFLEKNFVLRYLLAFNSIMAGDLEEPGRRLPELDPGTNLDYQAMAQRIKNMLARAELIKPITALDRQDLRGWHFVITGGVLLHLSPYGKEVMNGRYALIQDSPSLIKEGLVRLKAVLEDWEQAIPGVWCMPDKGSQILGQVTADFLGVPLEKYPEEGKAEPGLLVTYDLRKISKEQLQTLKDYRPGQILWNYAANWTTKQPVAGDLTTYLYQTNIPLWEKQLRRNPATGQVEQLEPAEKSLEDFVNRINSASPDKLDDLEVLRTFAKAAKPLVATNIKEGLREPQWANSPVPSNYFK
jgi:tetratricopeptide (TPR) repeat protein